MAFFEIPVNEGYIIYDTAGGVEYSTDIVTLNSGFEQRNQNWVSSKGQWDLGSRVVQQSEAHALNAFFRNMKGKANGFRFKDWLDFDSLVAGVPSGVLAITSSTSTPSSIAVGAGVPAYQLYKRYPVTGSYDYRAIKKPVAGKTVVSRNSVAVTAGTAAGNVAIDTTTGVITFVADATSSATVVTPGATTSVTLTGNPGTLVAGKQLYLSGFTGADAALLNNLAHAINSVSGTGPYVFVLATNTAGKAITLGSGLGSKFPQASDALTATFEFDVPVRFDTDIFQATFVTADITRPGVVAQGYFQINALPIVEIRV